MKHTMLLFALFACGMNAMEDSPTEHKNIPQGGMSVLFIDLSQEAQDCVISTDKDTMQALLDQLKAEERNDTGDMGALCKITTLTVGSGALLAVAGSLYGTESIVYPAAAVALGVLAYAHNCIKPPMRKKTE